MRIGVIGGGAAGFFSAIQIKEQRRDCEVVLFERSQKFLSKVAISGGGRCNVTCDTKEPDWLIDNYPRGGRRLLGPLHKFHPRDTIAWFEARGVGIKREDDGRHFPISDSSASIINCLTLEAKRLGVEIRAGWALQSCQKSDQHSPFVAKFEVDGESKKELFDVLVLATGSHKSGYSLAEEFGHTIQETVPSLFAFNCPSSAFLGLAGISVPFVKASLPEGGFEAYGPILFTHQGFSGPAILRLSAFGARWLHKKNYVATLVVDWLRAENELPRRLKSRLEDACFQSHFQIEGKTTNKSEFVTSGGVSLDEVDFQTMESRKVKGLFFAGELLDVDGLTGGFNFQNCWTGGWLIGQKIGKLDVPGCYIALPVE